jgi:superfamily I DNA/RNA helicase
MDPSKKMTEWTAEQKLIINSPADDPGFKGMVNAKAGSGKTSVVVELIRRIHARNPTFKILLLVFNKAMAEDVKSRISTSPYLDIRTFHSLALQKVVKDKNKEWSSDFNTITDFIQENWGKNKPTCKIISTGLSSFCRSSAKEVTKSDFKHLAKYKAMNPLRKTINMTEAISIASSVWKRTQKNDVPFTFDTMVKYMQENVTMDDVDLCIIDEAQDMYPVLYHWATRQTWNFIVVGDSNQQLYAWLNSVDSLDKLKGLFKKERIFQLTQSFRFGDNISLLVNWIYSKSVCPEKMGTPIRGLQNHYTNVSSSMPYEYYTVIGRTNFGLLEYIPSLKLPFQASPNLVRLAKNALKFIGYGHGALKKAKEQAELEGDDTRASILGFVLMNYKRAPTILNQVVASENKTDANVYLTTVHTAKGQEWDNVLLLPELFKHYDAESGKFECEQDDIFVLYVAITRVKNHLCIPSDFVKIQEALEVDFMTEDMRSGIKKYNEEQLKKNRSKKRKLDAPCGGGRKYKSSGKRAKKSNKNFL